MLIYVAGMEMPEDQCFYGVFSTLELAKQACDSQILSEWQTEWVDAMPGEALTLYDRKIGTMVQWIHVGKLDQMPPVPNFAPECE